MIHEMIAVVLGLFVVPPVGRPQDSNRAVVGSKEQLTQFLIQVKSSASSVSSDLSTLDFFAAQDGFRTHSAILEAYKDDIASLRNEAARLEEVRRDASSSQQVAIDRMSPAMLELVSAAEKAIQAGNSRSNRPEYTEYFKLNAELASELSNVISVWVDYASTREALDRAGQKLTAP